MKEADLIQVVGDGAIAMPGVADGRLIPYLLLDCRRRPDVHDAIINHQDQPPGDVVSAWAISRFSSEFVFLRLELKRPTVAKFMIGFQLTKHAMLVDGLLKANAAYIQANTIATTVAEGLDKEKILIEISSEGTPFDWEKVYQKTTQKQFRREGYSRKDSAECAKLAISLARDFWSMRKRKSA